MMMSMSGPNDPNDERGSSDPSSHAENAENGHSGEGSASALAHMISQGRDHRRQPGDADDAAGSRHS